MGERPEESAQPRAGDVILMPEILFVGVKPGYYVVVAEAEDLATLGFVDILEAGIAPTGRTINVPRDALSRFNATTHRMDLATYPDLVAAAASTQPPPPIRWGILSAARIANKFCEGAKALPDAVLTAVGARDLSRAREFAEKWGIARSYGSYEELVNDPDVDAVYVATTHNFHREHTLLALNAGKPVLCEKPFAINARESEDMVRAARDNGLFLMEAMWTRFFPIMQRIRELIADGAIGEPRIVQADFGFRGDYDPSSRLFDPNLGGGALLDVGIYVTSFASMVMGEPDRVQGIATLAPNGVDEQAAITLGYPGGGLASLTTAVLTNTQHEASIFGTEGRIRVHPEFWKPQRMTLYRSGQEPEDIHLPAESSGFNYEAAEVARCLRAGKLESDVMPLDESLAIMRTLDTLRAQWGIRYPMEN